MVVLVTDEEDEAANFGLRPRLAGTDAGSDAGSDGAGCADEGDDVDADEGGFSGFTDGTGCGFFNMLS